MAEIRVNVTASKSQRVNVSSSNISTEISATPDTSQFYSNLSKNWAIAENIVNNQDYSSKHYAQESKQFSEIAESYKNTAEQTYVNFTEQATNASNELSELREASVQEITTVKDEAVNSVTTAKSEAIDNITSTKTTILQDIEFIADGEKEEIRDLADDIKENAESVNTAIQAGVERLNSIDSLKQSQITNCLLEVPQRIKYELNDGTLTIKAGSVVIVPYGTEDLTAQYPVGSTFINDNFKIYDTQFADGKFFVWAEVQRDYSSKLANTITTKRLVLLNLTNFAFSAYTDSTSSSEPVTGVTTANNYRTDLNRVELIRESVATDSIASLPLFVSKSDGVNLYAEITQIFNGMGYIGSTVWVDKGVKVLAPNGRNEDGTLKNMEIVTSSIVTSTSTSTQDYIIRLGWNSTLTKLVLAHRQTRYNLTVKNLEELKQLDVSVAYFVHVLDENCNYYTSNSEWLKSISVPIINATLTNGVVSNFQPKQPFRAVDVNEMQEVQCVVETYKNGTSWYRIWSDGWCEQGGAGGNASSAVAVTITFLKPFIDNTYSLTGGALIPEVAKAVYSVGFYDRTTTQFSASLADDESINKGTFTWQACGYIK